LYRINKNSIDISTENNGGRVTLFSRTYDKTVDFNIKIPKNFSLNLNTHYNGTVEVIIIVGSVEVENSNSNIILENINRSSVLSTTYGSISA
jgi:hypothetical protein